MSPNDYVGYLDGADENERKIMERVLKNILYGSQECSVDISQLRWLSDINLSVTLMFVYNHRATLSGFDSKKNKAVEYLARLVC